MKHIHFVSRQPALAQSTKQTAKDTKGQFMIDAIDRLTLTARSAAWGIKFPTDGA